MQNVSSQDKGDHSERLCIDLQSPPPSEGTRGPGPCQQSDPRSHPSPSLWRSSIQAATRPLVENTVTDDSSDRIHICLFKCAFVLFNEGFMDPAVISLSMQMSTDFLLTQSDHVPQ
ncbi:unnamed protein product [Pleuronectes platessa]|uniref:Uncharacterized protein n=1 Tax=Pleuronectes platessa TaxID=8262 RepID=A0A9N7TR16_PLEPL|nr:unnamed protein product [Pleuronectes platessa]